MRIKRVVKAAAFCIILVFFLNSIYKIFSWKDTAGDYYSSIESFYDLKEDLVDVLFLGSSRCYCTINNAVLWEEEGISSFSLAISGQDIASSYHCFVEALKTQTPEVVCFELYGTTFQGYGVDSNMYRNTLPYHYSLNAVNVVRAIAPDRQEELLLRWPIVHTRYTELKKQDFEAERPAYVGYHSEFATKPVDTLWSGVGTEELAIGEAEEMWLRKIISLAKENDIELCFFVAPAMWSEKEQKNINYVEKIARENGVPVLNMAQLEQELQLNRGTDFIDTAHTNYYGSKKVSSFMANFLKQNYDLKDRRGEAGYELWNENSIVRGHEYQNQILKTIYVMQDYLEQLSSMEEYTIIITSSGNYLSEEVDVEDYVYLFGLENFYTASGIWVIENGEQVYSGVGADVLKYMDIQEDDLAVYNTSGITGVIINRQEYAKTQNGINIVVYDNVLGQVVDAVGFDATGQYRMVR